jgi:ribosome-associated protein
MADLRVNENISIREDEIEERFIHSPGPGGQHVNKAATGVQLRFNLRGCLSLPEPVRDRLSSIAGKRVNKDGVLVIEAHSHRSLERNRQDARHRLLRLVREALQIPKRRVKSRPSRSSVERRLEQKRHQSKKKQDRRPPDI